MSPRPRKRRHCTCPFGGGKGTVFKPAGIPLNELETVLLPHDEFEAMHLCDVAGLTQEEAGMKMGVSRGTVQRLVTSGRRKLVTAVLEGKALVVQPGDV